MNAKTVLVSGAGIGGPMLAFWLKAGGFEPTLIEHAPALRAGGFVIDFWGHQQISCEMARWLVTRCGHGACIAAVADRSGPPRGDLSVWPTLSACFLRLIPRPHRHAAPQPRLRRRFSWRKRRAAAPQARSSRPTAQSRDRAQAARARARAVSPDLPDDGPHHSLISLERVELSSPDEAYGTVGGQLESIEFGF